MGGNTSKQEYMGELSVDSEDDVVVRQRKEACDFIEGKD